MIDDRFLKKKFQNSLVDKPVILSLPESRAKGFPPIGPIPELLLAALSGGADPYGWGVISSADIRTYMVDHIHSPSLTPQEGKLDNPAFAEGAFLFRIINSGNRAPDESQTIHLYRAAADGGDADAQVNLGLLYETGRGGLPKDDREAARLYKLAADRGNSRGGSISGASTRLVAAACLRTIARQRASLSSRPTRETR